MIITSTIRGAMLTLAMTAVALTARGLDNSAAYTAAYQNTPFKAEAPKAPVIPDLTVNITDFGAVGDGITLNTDAFARAIEHVASRGGGHVVVPEGVWLTGPITMRSNIDLHAVKNAIVLFSPEKVLYPILPPDRGTGSALCTAPVNASGIRNFSITGEGVFDGNGEAWRPIKRFKVSDAEWKKLQRLELVEAMDGGSAVFYPLLGNSDGEIARKRPRLFRFIECSDFMIQGVVAQNSPSFHVNMILCHDFILDGITVRCPWNAQNGDGIDLSSCRNALLLDCSVDCGDDAICLKSGIGDVGRDRGPCDNIVIERCTVFHGHGGFVIGSDNSGGMNNIYVHSCRFIDTDTGLRFKSGRDRGGLITNVWVSDIVMCDIADEAILFDCYYQEKVGDAENVQAIPVTPDTPRFDGIDISNIVCTGAGRAIVVKGLPEMNVRNVTIANSTIQALRGAVVNHATDFTLRNVTIALPASDPATPTLSQSHSTGVIVE